VSQAQSFVPLFNNLPLNFVYKQLNIYVAFTPSIIAKTAIMIPNPSPILLAPEFTGLGLGLGFGFGLGIGLGSGVGLGTDDVEFESEGESGSVRSYETTAHSPNVTRATA
jgi:hypothetical protein